MNKIDSNGWKTFTIGDLFPEIVKPFVYHTKDVVEDKDGIPYVVRSKFNNGVKYRVLRPQGQVNPARVISFGAENASFFYQKEEWVSGRDMYYINVADIDEYACLFIITCLQPIAAKYSYNFGLFPDLLKRETLKLPVDQTGRPDFSYMETYMKNRAVAVSSELTALQSAQKLEFFKRLDTKTWAEFKIKELFDIKRPAPRSQANYSEGTVPFVASGNYNNGVLKCLQPNENEPLEQGGCITVSPVDGSAFYQEKPFLGRGGAGSSIILLYNAALDLYSGYFIATVIRSVCSKYAYSDMANKETISDEVIKLPVDDKNQPDYQLMSDYMVSILEKKRRTLQGLRTCI